MRDFITTTPTRRKKPKRQLPLGPRSFAVDLTPPNKRISKEARGAAVLRRGSFESYLATHDAKLGPGQKKAVDLLRKDRSQLLLPKNASYLAALQRTQPGDDLYEAIRHDSHLSEQHQLLKAGVHLAPAARLKLQEQGLHNDEIDRVAAGHISGDQAMQLIHTRQQAHGEQLARHEEKIKGLKPGTMGFNPGTKELFQKVTPSDWFGRLAGGGMEAVVGMAPFMYHMATTDPRRSLPEIGGAVGHSFAQTATHPIRQLKEDPFSFFSNTLGVAGGGVGVGGRISSASAAVAERAAGEGALGAAARGFTHPQVRSLIDLYESKSPAYQARLARETEDVAGQIREAADSQQSRVVGVGSRLRTTGRNVKRQIKETKAADIRRPGDIMETRGMRGYVGPAGAHVARNFEVGMRELTDGVRAGAIYLRPAYLPNNWAGNLFMNLTHQGAYAPINLAKTFVMHKQLNPRELRMLRAATGQTAAHAIAGRGRGYIRALTDPVAHVMGRFADQPFRDAAMLHELRRAGYRTLGDVKAFVKEADASPEAMTKLAGIGRKAQEEIVKFGRLSDTEQNVIRNVFFVWNWVKGASRYAGRFPLQHPITSNVLATGGRQIGNPLVQSKVGGLPPYLVGNIPVGHGKFSNPLALNPLGTAVQVGRAIQGTSAEIHGKFDPHTQEDFTSLLNPVWGSLIEAREGIGGRNYIQNVVRNIAPYNLYQGLAHPGSGSTFPGTRREAIGHYVFGSLYPRKYDPQAIQAALERMNVNHPEKLIPDMIKRYEKKTGQKVPPALVSAYRRDLHELQAQKNFKSDFAHSKNSPSWRRLPAINRAEGAMKYIRDNHLLPKDQTDQLQQALDGVTSDAQAKELESALWSITNVGSAKRAWNALMQTTKPTLTRSR